MQNDVPSASVQSGIVVVGEPTRLSPAVEDRVGEIDRVTWVMPNGTRITTNGTQAINYTFNETGEHRIQLIAEDEYGATGTSNASIVVHEHYPSDGAGIGALFVIMATGVVVVVVGSSVIVAVLLLKLGRRKNG